MEGWEEIKQNQNDLKYLSQKNDKIKKNQSLKQRHGRYLTDIKYILTLSSC